MSVTPTVARRARYKLLCSILTTHGYAILALAVIQPFFSSSPRFTLIQAIGLMLGLAAQSFAIYIAPYGKPP